LDVVTAFLNPEDDDDDINRTPPEGWPEGLNAPSIVVRIKKALHGLKQAPQLWHNDINTILPSLEFKQSQADHNLSLHNDCILMLLYVDNISMLAPEETNKAVTHVKARLSEKYKITSLGPAPQVLSIEIHHEKYSTGTGTTISLGPKGLHHHDSQTIQYAECSRWINSNGS